MLSYLADQQLLGWRRAEVLDLLQLVGLHPGIRDDAAIPEQFNGTIPPTQRVRLELFHEPILELE